MSGVARLALLTAPMFSNNMGCNALTYASVAILQGAGRRIGREFEFILAGNPADGVISEELGEGRYRLIEQVPGIGLRGALASAYRREFQQRRQWLKALDAADVYLDNAAGDSFSDIYGSSRFRQVERKIRYAFSRGKPLILLPQTIGPFRSISIRDRAANILHGAHTIYARDPLSAECARGLAPGKAVIETVDVAFFLPCGMVRKSPGNAIRVGFNPSGLLWRGGYTGANQFGLKDDYPELVRHLIRRLLATRGVEVELIGHDISGPNGGNRNDDYYVCKRLCREFPECRIGPFFYGPSEAKAHIAGLDAFVGSRMHACIAAYSSGVPVLPLAYSRKFEGQFVEKLNYRQAVDLTVAGREEAAVIVDDFLVRREAIRREFPGRLAELEREKTALEEHLAGQIEGVLAGGGR